MEFVKSKPCSKKKNPHALSFLFQTNSSQKRLSYFLEIHFIIVFLLIKYFQVGTTI